MPQDVKQNTRSDSPDLPTQGFGADESDSAALRRALEFAVNYRGDVTLTDKASGRDIECFVYDLKDGGGDRPAQLRYIEKSKDARESIAIGDIASVRFTGKDTAAGKSFETWMKKYVRQKLAGQVAGIESESLDEHDRGGSS